jgi:hypothetical protein
MVSKIKTSRVETPHGIPTRHYSDKPFRLYYLLLHGPGVIEGMRQEGNRIGVEFPVLKKRMGMSTHQLCGFLHSLEDMGAIYNLVIEVRATVSRARFALVLPPYLKVREDYVGVGKVPQIKGGPQCRYPEI